MADAASDQLRAAVPGADPAELAAVGRGMTEWLSDRLCWAAARALVTCLKTESFATLLASDPLPDVLAQHPGLAELLAALARNAVAAAAELLTRLDHDRALVAEFLGGTPGRVTTAVFGRGDAHCGGRTVSELGFASGARLIYRPRPVGLHARWNDLLADLAPLVGDLARAAVVERPGYGWVQYVHARPAADVDRFYRRLGAQLVLLHLLGATDIHAENVVAAGDHPVVVDVETLFQPRWTPHIDGGSDPGLEALETSVLNTFVLPRPVFGPYGRLDLSAFGGRPGRFPHDLPAWADAGTDRMRLVRGPAPYSGGQNLPAADVDPAAHGSALLAGFRAAYRVLAAHRDRVLRGLDRFAGAELRIVPRASEWYADLLRESTEPVFLREIDGRAKAFAALDDVTAYPHFSRFADASRADLLAGDIPYFAASADGRDVRTASGTQLPGILETDGLTAARARIAGLSEQDLRAQSWFTEASLATMTPFAGHRMLPGAVAEVETPDPARLLELAVGIGDELLLRASADATRTNWPSLEIAEDGDWCVRQLGASLGSGYCGVALFLAELGKISGQERFLDAAVRTVRPLPGLIELLDGYPSLAVGVGPGAFTGVGGIAYAVARLAGLLRESTLDSLVPAAVRATAAAARDTDSADVADGLAGALLAVSAIADGTGSPEASALVAELSERLAVLPPLPAGGFLFGRAGAARALRLAGRVPSGEGEATGLGWCSGLAGLVLADPRPGVVARFRTALERRLPSPDHSLCHGELGVLDAARAVGAPVRLPRGALACGTPAAVPTPGLLHGLAGLGHGLLRLGFAGRVPALVLLEPGPPGS